MSAKTGWKCPKCGREFARKSNYHGCGTYSVEGYLEGKNPAGVGLFGMLAEAAAKFTGVSMFAAKTQVTFRVRANFLMASVSGKALCGHLFLPRAVAKRYFKKVVQISSRRHGHLFRIEDEASLRDFLELLPEAIAMVSEEKKEKAAARAPSIGEEINALYRAERQRLAP